MWILSLTLIPVQRKTPLGRRLGSAALRLLLTSASACVTQVPIVTTSHFISSFPLPKFKFEELQCNRRLSYLKENQVLLDVLTVCLPQLLMLTGKTTEGKEQELNFPVSC